ncbi:hypothetical protein [Chryseobacterium sp.]|uniref:hypothetical protein n=1 Tax=Chryseobacterium sp. TaxID=1871047 RepID=UPI00388F3AB0
MFDKGLTIRVRQSTVHPIVDLLLHIVESGQVKLDDIITHRFALDEVAKGYEIFHEWEDGSVKVVLDPWK